MTTHIASHANFADLILGHYEAKPIPKAKPEPVMVSAWIGQPVVVNANQGRRDGYVIAVAPDGSEGIVEYIMPSLQTYRLRFRSELLQHRLHRWPTLDSSDGKSFGSRWPAWAKGQAESDKRLELRTELLWESDAFHSLTRSKERCWFRLEGKMTRELGPEKGRLEAMRMLVDGEIELY